MNLKIAVLACLGAVAANAGALENIALGKSYTFSRPPNYIYCTDPGDKTQLTDGYYDRQPQQIWVRKETVGWSVGGPEALAVTIDLGKVEPIAGVSFNFAAGFAGVNFPKGIYVYVGEDGKTWRFLGDVLRQSTLENTPPKRDGYEVYRAWSDKMPGRGRYVMFLVSTTGFLFSDEIEVYRGDPKLLKGEAPGRIVADPFAHIGSFVVRERVEMDLKRLAPGDRTLATEVDRLLGEICVSNAILPLCETHRRVWTKNAKNLRAAGFAEPVLWKADRWANLDALVVPEKSLVTDDPLTVEMMRGEVRATAVNFLNPTERRIVYEVTVEGLPAFANVDCREVPFTDTPSFVPVAAALLPGRGASISLPVEAGASKQLWISFHRPSAGCGTFTGRLVARAAGAKTLEKPIRLVLHDVDFPKACELHLGGFDYMIGRCDFYRAPGNVASHVAFFEDNYIDMPWAPWGVSPQGAKADATGHIANPEKISYTVWDEWVARFPSARLRAVYISAERFKGRTSRFGYAGFDLGSPAFNRFVGEYFKRWAEHMRNQGVDPKSVVFLIVDEPGDRREPTEYPKVIVAWAKAIKAAVPEFQMMVDPDYEKDASIAGREMYEVCDIVCPKLDYTADPGHEFNRDFFLKRVPREKLWFYQCNGPSRSLDPIAYYRQHFWSCWEYGAHAAAFWAFGCGGGIGNSWRAYAQTSAEYSPYFVGPTEVTSAKQSEGIREGMQDYEYLRMLKAEIAAAKKRGVDVSRAEKILVRAVQVALNQTGGGDRGAYSRADSRQWAVAKDRSAPDRARLAVLRTLSALKERPLLTVGVLSDMHVIPGSSREADFLKALRYFDALKVDAVFSSGDSIDYGWYEWYEHLGKLWFSVFPENRRSDGERVEPCFIYGDHETGSLFNPRLVEKFGEKYVAERDIPVHGEDITYEKAFHEKWAPIQKKTVKGFDIVMAHHTYTSNWKKEHRSKDCWQGQNIPHLEEFLRKTPLDSSKPFFFLMHRSIKGTVIWPTNFSQNDGSTRRALNPHPNCVVFCGHHHHDVTDERSLWQEEFTAVACPSLWDAETQLGHENGNGFRIPMRQMKQVTDGCEHTGQFLVLRVYPGRMILERRAILNLEKVADDWVIPWPQKGEADFETRKARSAVPAFGPEARVSVSKPFVGKDLFGKTRDQVKVSFPTVRSSSCSARAHDYRVTVESRRFGMERILREKFVFSPASFRSENLDTNDSFCVFCHADIPNPYEEIRFKVTPRNGFGKEGRPIYSGWQSMTLREEVK